MLLMCLMVEDTMFVRKQPFSLQSTCSLLNLKGGNSKKDQIIMIVFKLWLRSKEIIIDDYSVFTYAGNQMYSV